MWPWSCSSPVSDRGRTQHCLREVSSLEPSPDCLPLGLGNDDVHCFDVEIDRQADNTNQLQSRQVISEQLRK